MTKQEVIEQWRQEVGGNVSPLYFSFASLGFTDLNTVDQLTTALMRPEHIAPEAVAELDGKVGYALAEALERLREAGQVNERAADDQALNAIIITAAGDRVPLPAVDGPYTGAAAWLARGVTWRELHQRLWMLQQRLAYTADTPLIAGDFLVEAALRIGIWADNDAAATVRLTGYALLAPFQRRARRYDGALAALEALGMDRVQRGVCYALQTYRTEDAADARDVIPDEPLPSTAANARIRDVTASWINAPDAATLAAEIEDDVPERGALVAVAATSEERWVLYADEEGAWVQDDPAELEALVCAYEMLLANVWKRMPDHMWV